MKNSENLNEIGNAKHDESQIIIETLMDEDERPKNMNRFWQNLKTCQSLDSLKLITQFVILNND